MHVYRSLMCGFRLCSLLLPAGGLATLELDFDAHGCVFASRLLEGQPLPLLRTAALQNVEAQHLAVLHTLPRLRELSLSRHINGPGGF